MLAEGRLNVLHENGQQTGRQLLSVMALTQKVALLLASGREPEARKALSQALDAAAGGVLQPFDALVKEHSDWLRGQLLSITSTRCLGNNCWNSSRSHQPGRR